ncbi:MAG: hypothetical protein JW716_04820 [Candidatus Aenigmarchaeota archaeon]|nr:hypothetical protein [Candidatus Aenigmarchaeota archaeon]
MFGKEKKEEIEKDLNDERIDLAEYIEKAREEATEKLDETLSKNKMEFCSRCGRKVDSRMEWGGKCIRDGCTELICIDCWENGKKKCKVHSNEGIISIKEEPKKKQKETKEPEKTDEETEVISKEEELKEVPIRNIVQRASGITNDENVIMGYASDFREFVHDRLVIYGTPDFSPKGYFEHGKFRTEDNSFLIFRKFLIFKRGMLRIHILPFARYEPPLENYIAGIINGAGRGIYNIFVFVTDTGRITRDTIDLINRFESMASSLFFYDAQKRQLHRSSDGLDLFYSSWLDPNQRPMFFKDLVKIPSEMTGDIAVLSVRGFARYMKMDERKALRILKGCGLLKRIKGSDSFMLKF